MNKKEIQKYEEYLISHKKLIQQGWEQLKGLVDERIYSHDEDKIKNINTYVEARLNNEYKWSLEPLLSHSKNRHHFLLNEILENDDYNIVDLIESILDIKSAVYGKLNSNTPKRRWFEDQDYFRNKRINCLKITSLYENSFKLIMLTNLSE